MSSKRSWIREFSVYLMVILLISLQATHILQYSLFLGTSRTGTMHGLKLSIIYSPWKMSYNFLYLLLLQGRPYSYRLHDYTKVLQEQDQSGFQSLWMVVVLMEYLQERRHIIFTRVLVSYLVGHVAHALKLHLLGRLVATYCISMDLDFVRSGIEICVYYFFYS